MRRARLLPGACLTVAVVMLGGCGGSSGATGATALPAAGKSTRLVDASRPPYITGLAINPADHSVLLATNKGLWSIDSSGGNLQQISAQVQADGQTGAFGERVSSLGFLNPGELLGSGHPDGADRGLPPFLGVITSTDGGHSWTAITRVGFSDLHVLVISGTTVYGFDTVLGGVVASYDGGRNFSERSSPPGEFVLDLAIDPHANQHLLGSTDTAIFSSPDGGNTWKQISTAPATHLAWTSHGLYRADADRSVETSTDGGTSWQRVGELPATPGKLVETADGTLYAALTEGSIVSSHDGGHTWTTFFAP